MPPPFRNLSNISLTSLSRFGKKNKSSVNVDREDAAPQHPQLAISPPLPTLQKPSPTDSQRDSITYHELPANDPPVLRTPRWEQRVAQETANIRFGPSSGKPSAISFVDPHYDPIDAPYVQTPASARRPERAYRELSGSTLTHKRTSPHSEANRERSDSTPTRKRTDTLENGLRMNPPSPVLEPKRERSDSTPTHKRTHTNRNAIVRTPPATQAGPSQPRVLDKTLDRVGSQPRLNISPDHDSTPVPKVTFVDSALERARSQPSSLYASPSHPNLHGVAASEALARKLNARNVSPLERGDSQTGLDASPSHETSAGVASSSLLARRLNRQKEPKVSPVERSGSQPGLNVSPSHDNIAGPSQASSSTAPNVPPAVPQKSPARYIPQVQRETYVTVGMVGKRDPLEDNHPLPEKWEATHDRAICILDVRQYSPRDMIYQFRRTFPEVCEGEIVLTPGMIDRRLRQLDNTYECYYFRDGLAVLDEERERASGRMSRKEMARSKSMAALVGDDI